MRGIKVNFDKSQETLQKHSYESVIKASNENYPHWEELGRVEVIRNWSQEILHAREQKLPIEEWFLIGTAITIIHHDIDDCRDILGRVATDINFSYLIANQNVLNELVSSKNELPAFDHPTLIYLEPGEWMKSSDDIDEKNLLTQQYLIEKIRSFNPDNPVIFATSSSNYNEITKDLRVAGLFDRRFLVLRPTLEEEGRAFLRLVGDELCNSSLHDNLGKVGKLLDLEFDDKRRQELIALTLKRISKKEGRKLEFGDLVYLSTQGSAESDEYPKRSVEFDRKIAVHEAGHAVIAMIDSEGKNIPEYVSILEAENYNGVVSDSMSYHLSKHKSRTYADIRHQIRVSLAGRVAEHLVYGSENISIASATDDLRKATELCFYMFSSRGVSNDMGSLEGACSNLTIEREEDKPFNLKRTEAIARTYLADQYKIVHEMLVKNRLLFNSIVDKLVSDAVLNQKDLHEIERDIKL